MCYKLEGSRCVAQMGVYLNVVVQHQHECSLAGQRSCVKTRCCESVKLLRHFMKKLVHLIECKNKFSEAVSKSNWDEVKFV
jgi:hypothetical protein